MQMQSVCKSQVNSRTLEDCFFLILPERLPSGFLHDQLIPDLSMYWFPWIFDLLLLVSVNPHQLVSTHFASDQSWALPFSRTDRSSDPHHALMPSPTCDSGAPTLPWIIRLAHS